MVLTVERFGLGRPCAREFVGILSEKGMTNSSDRKCAWLVVAISALLVGALSQVSETSITSAVRAQVAIENQKPGSKKVKSVILTKVGNTKFGIIYRKEFTLSAADASYRLNYVCKGWRCDCKQGEREIKPSFAEEFFIDLETLKDLGVEARCCDRPWTEIEVNYVDGSSKMLSNVAGIGAAGVKIFKLGKNCATVGK